MLSPLSGAYLLVILGEPISEDHKEKMLEKLRKGKYAYVHRLHFTFPVSRLVHGSPLQFQSGINFNPPVACRTYATTWADGAAAVAADVYRP